MSYTPDSQMCKNMSWMGVVLLNINCKFSNKTFNLFVFAYFFTHSGNDKFVTLEQWGIYGLK